ncbi:hypothetical protein K440DRAFT_368190 [Wilcoxina mikolae CBS 423.85]|nr:hypothetical protein K440DRAFT_368190 [Wilcoxina mikolae CBS 423.85]
MSSSKQVIITADDHGPSINLVAWISLTIMCLAALTKVFSRTWNTRSLPGDSLFIIIAMIMAVGQTVAVSEQVAVGLGRRGRELSSSQIENYQKAGYSAEMLYIPSLCFAKLATLSFLGTLAQTAISRTIVKVSMVFTGVWTFVAMIGIAFQCHLPRPWAILSNQCFNQPAFWDAIGAFDVMIDLVLVGLPIFVLWDLQVPLRKKASIMGAFATRALVIPLTILRLIYISSASKSSDKPFDDFNTAVTTEVGMNLAIVLACFPFIKTFMDSVQTGLLTAKLHTAGGKSVRSGASYAMGSFGSYGKMSAGKNSVAKESTATCRSGQWMDEPNTHTTITAAIREDVESRSSSGGSDRMIIRQTNDIAVEFEIVGGDDGRAQKRCSMWEGSSK